LLPQPIEQEAAEHDFLGERSQKDDDYYCKWKLMQVTCGEIAR
jgi:hypothetical protein